MASEAGRGAQVRLDDTARQLARGGAGLRLIDSVRQKQALEDSGVAPSGLTPDGSLGNGVPADDEVLLPGGVLAGIGGGGGGAPSYSGGAVVSLGGQFYLIPPGPYADDAGAATAGVPLGAAYRHTSSVVKVRET